MCTEDKLDGRDVHVCEYSLLDSPICRYHEVACIYQCCTCGRYHICDGGTDCLVLNTGENMVCVLTCNCVSGNIQGVENYLQKTFTALQQNYDSAAYDGLLLSIHSDIVSFFTRASNKDLVDIAGKIIEHGDLKYKLKDLVNSTFVYCHKIFEENSCGYDLICSIYINIIISIFSTKTVYGSLLFKCTKNKKYDSIVKTMREIWMSTLITGDI